MVAILTRVLCRAVLFASLVSAVAFDGPVATPVVHDNGVLDVNGWTPRPTRGPEAVLELFKRQEEDPAVCGYIEGNPQRPVSCRAPGALYGFDTIYNWFGCCLGTRRSDCGIATACVDYDSIESCQEDPECYDQLLTACTRSASPYCKMYHLTVSSETFVNFQCDSLSTTYTVSLTPDGGSGVFPSRTRDDESSERSRFVPTVRISSAEGEETSTATEEEKTTITFVLEETSSRETETAGPSESDSSIASVSGPTQIPTQVSSGIAARRTAEVAVGVLGGVAGVLGLVI